MKIMEMANWFTLILCGGLLCISLKGWMAQPRDSVIAGNKTKKKMEWSVFAVLMLLALVLRAWQLGNVPGGVNQDEAMAAVDALALADHATDRYGMYMPVHFTAWGYGQMSVLMSYFMVPFIKIFGFSSVTVRLPVLLASVAGMAVLYFLFKRLFGLAAAQIVLAFLVLNPWHFMQSRWALDCNMFPHMFVIALFLMLCGIAEKKRYLYLSMVFYAFCMYSYGISFYTVPVFLLAASIYMLVNKVIRWRDAGICIGVYGIVSWPVYTSMIINALHLETIRTPFFTIPYFPDSVRSQDILFFADHKWEQFLSNIKSMVTVVLHGDTLPWNTIEGYGVIYTCFLLFIPFGIYLAVHMLRKETDAVKKTGLVCLMFFLGMGILAGVITQNVNVNRVNIIIYPMIIFSALGIYFAYINIKKMVFALVPVYLLLGCLFLHSYYNDFAENIRYTFYDGFIQSVQDLEENSDCQIYCITPDSQYEGSSNVSEILTLYALQMDAEYYQGKAEDGEVPYREKFYYCNSSQTQVNAGNGFAYVISNNELGMFSPEEWHIETHDNFSSVIPLNNYTGE